MLLKDKVTLVTGGAQGIGRTLAEAFAKEGAKLVICDVNEESLKNAADEMKKNGAEVLAVKANVSSSSDVDEVIKKTVDNYGTIDILINNAGITRDNLMLRMSEDEWDAVLNINLKGTFLFTKACCKVMSKKRTGCIINVASIIGVIGNAGQANYAASKAGVIGLTKTAAKEFAKRNVRVNAIAPGFIQTAMTDKLSEEIRELMIKQIPLARMGQPGDVADLAVFLASENASYITGQVIRIDGGMVI